MKHLLWMSLMLLTTVQPAFAQQNELVPLDMMTPAQQLTASRFMTLIDQHSDPKLKADFLRWENSQVLQYAFFGEFERRGIAVTLLDYSRGDKVLLLMDSSYLAGPRPTDLVKARDKFLGYQLELYGIYVQIRNHFDKTDPIPPPTVTTEASASYRWRMALGAARGQWELAKRMGRKDLLPTAAAEAETHGEALGVLEACYQNMMRQMSPREAKLYSPLWKQFYEEEKKKIKAANPQ